MNVCVPFSNLWLMPGEKESCYPALMGLFESVSQFWWVTSLTIQSSAWFHAARRTNAIFAQYTPTSEAILTTQAWSIHWEYQFAFVILKKQLIYYYTTRMGDMEQLSSRTKVWNLLACLSGLTSCTATSIHAWLLTCSISSTEGFFSTMSFLGVGRLLMMTKSLTSRWHLCCCTLVYDTLSLVSQSSNKPLELNIERLRRLSWVLLPG